jgi:DNA modification methylase
MTSVKLALRQASHSLPSFLRKVDAQLRFREAPELSELVNWSQGQEVPVHRWFRYREGFSPRLISDLQLGQNLLDPFCGGGSIMVGAAQLERRSIGLDVNPLATFVARVKLSPLDSAQLERSRQFAVSFGSYLTSLEPWGQPELRIVPKVFEPSILETLLRIRRAIEEYANHDEAIRDFLLLAWISILEDVGSYFKEGNGIKYRNKKRLKTGYIWRPDGEWQLERFGADQVGFVRRCYSERLQQMVSDACEWNRGTWRLQHVITGNSLELLSTLDEHSFDSIIFSPPYANRFDYFESLKVELWFGGFVSSYDEMKLLRKQSLRSHLGSSLANDVSEWEPLEDLIERIDRESYAWRMRVPALLRGYFYDMEQVLAMCRQLLRPGGKCFCVVGNSAYGGVIVPTDSLLALLGLRAGFQDVEIRPVRHLTVAPQQRVELLGLEEFMRESVVVLS